MSFFYEQLKQHLKNQGLSYGELQAMARIQGAVFKQWKDGSRKPTKADLQKLAAVKELDLSYETLMAWRIQDMMQNIDPASLAALQQELKNPGKPNFDIPHP